MRIVLLEDKVYRLNERQFNGIIEDQRKLNERFGNSEYDIEMSDYLELWKPGYKLLGPVEFDFRL